MRAIAVALALVPSVSAADDGFLDWFSTELAEVDAQELIFDGTIPSWVNGTMVQAGPGRFEVGNVSFGHALDGFSKINRFEFSSAGGSVKVAYSTSFLQSAFLRESIQTNTIAPSMLAGETTPSTRKELGMKSASGPNDNNYIKSHIVGGVEIMASDTPILMTMSGVWANVTSTFQPNMPTIPGQKPDTTITNPVHWVGDVLPGIAAKDHLCMMGSFAHGFVDPHTGELIVGMACNAVVPALYRDYHVVFKADPKNLSHRTPIKAVKLPKGRLASYQHHNGVTDNYYVLIGVPLFMDTTGVMQGKCLAEGGLSMPMDTPTLFQIIDRKNPSAPVREIEVPGFQMGHVINIWEEGDDIVLDLTYYTQESGGFFPRYLLKNMKDPAARDQWPRGTVKRYRLKADGTYEETLTLPDEAEPDMELPMINPHYWGKKHCVFYAEQFHYNNASFGTIAYVKRNICSGEKAGLYRKGMYPGEHTFVPRPGATEEDDGVLIGMQFDGATTKSSVEVVDAKTMKVLAEAPLGLKVPFPIHTTWFEDGKEILPDW